MLDLTLNSIYISKYLIDISPQMFNMTHSKPYSWFHHPPQPVWPKVSFFILNRNFILPVSKFQSSFTTLFLSYLFQHSFSKSFQVFLQIDPEPTASNNLHHWHFGTSSHLLFLHYCILHYTLDWSDWFHTWVHAIISPPSNQTISF